MFNLLFLFKYFKYIFRSETFIKSADVVCCTCICAGDNRLSDCRFKNVLIDDSTQATESECMIPIELSSNKLILVGEHQLEPITESKESASVGLIDKSLFERLVLLGVQPIQFHVKYWIHSGDNRKPSNCFFLPASIFWFILYILCLFLK